MVIVTGKPAAPLQRLGRASGFHLLPIDWPDPPDGVKAELTGADYPGLLTPGERVQTVAFANALIGRKKDTNDARDRVLAFFAETILSRAESLAGPGRHPKWREFDPGRELPNWTRYAPVERKLSLLRTAPAAAATSGSGYRRDDDTEKLFREFLDWRRQRGNEK
jgi:uncharacterized protein